MSSEPYVPSEDVVKRAYVDAHLRDDRGGIPEEVSEPEFDRFIAKVQADALRAFADELESQERVSPDDAMTILAMRERADEILTGENR